MENMEERVKIVKPSAKLIWITQNAIQIMELAGRTAYKSEDKITPDSASKFVKMIIEKGHLTVIEHASASIKVVCDRGVSHEIVRHRLFSFTQESTRFCNYSNAKFGEEITVIEPPNLTANQHYDWIHAVIKAEEYYFSMLSESCSPQIARSVLPNCLKTEIVITGNFREWKHFLSLRTAPAAHPQMREIAKMIQEILNAEYPEVFPI
jgi:thymidylate synthase (FAD)